MMESQIIGVGYREALRLAKQNHGMKFLDLNGNIVSSTGLKKVTKGYFGRNLVKTFNDKIQYSYFPIKKQKPVKRWDSFRNEWRNHNYDCEFAVGDDCTCWCDETYHGWMGNHTDKESMKSIMQTHTIIETKVMPND